MQSNHMERMHMWSSFKIVLKTYGCHPTWLSLLQKNRKLLSKFLFFRFIWPNGFRGEESNFFNSFLFFTDFFSLIFKFEKRQWPCLMAVAVIIHSLKENYCSSFLMISKKSSPLKPLCQMNRNLVGCIYGRSSIKIAHFVPIH
jgi:hypothetical protein